MLDRHRAEDVLGRSISLARTEQLTLLAAGVAFYAFVSLVPLALLTVALATTVGGDALVARVTTAASDVLTPSALDLVAETLVDDTGRRSATAVGAVGLLWGSSRVLRGLDRAFALVYGTAAAKSFVDSLWDVLIVSAAIVVGLGAVAVIEAVLLFVPPALTGLTVVGYALVVLGLLAAFLPMYVVFPDANVGVREALPGAIVATIGWFLLSRTFGLYAAFAGEFAVYGAIGAVFLVLAWLYVASAVVVFGAVVNAVLAGRDTDRQLQSPGARQISTEAMSDDASSADEDGTGADPRGDDPREERRSGADGSDGRGTSRTRDRADDPQALREEIARLRDQVESFEDDVERRTVRKESVESELKRYVRRRVRRSHAHGWGPYLVLLYGTIMAVAAFRFLEGGWAILAMFVVWTSTLGVYVLMVLFGAGLSVLGLPGRLRDRVGEWRS
ncbi:YihY family inner membrane protein [Halobacteria archaeon AArc-dxtr1]|nr:YihY family inner membrane protein [Halobacteria archaeon AArc-dxtr1]